MSQLLQKILTGVLRTFLAPLLVWLVDKNIITSSESGQLVAEVSIYVGIALWSLFAWIKAHRTQLTALAMPKGSTLDQLADKVRAKETVPVATPSDATPIITKQLPVILLAIALGAAALSGVSCAGTTPPLVMPTSAAAVATDDAALRAYAQKSLGVLDASLDVIREVNVAEKQVEILMSASMRTNTRAALTAVTQQIIAAAQAIKQGSTTFARLKALLDPVLAKVQALVDLVHALPASAQNRAGFGPLVSSLLGIVTTIVTGAHQ